MEPPSTIVPDVVVADEGQQPPPIEHPNWIPPELRKPEDEFFDLTSIEPLHMQVICPEGGLEMLTIVEGSGSHPEPGDVVYYKHQTRFSNGQLVEFDERRKVTDMHTIDSPKYHAFLNVCFKTMRRGQIAWIKIGEFWHKGGYHTEKNLRKPYMKANADVTQTIWLKAEISNIKRDARCDNHATFEEKLAYYDKVRESCRELVGFQEYSNASDLYARCVQVLRSIPKIKLEQFSAVDLEKKDKALSTLFTNMSFCLLKK